MNQDNVSQLNELMPKQINIYLAGPDVFFYNADQIGIKKKQIINEVFKEVAQENQVSLPLINIIYPLDLAIKATDDDAIAKEIAHQCEEAIFQLALHEEGIFILVANISPFRGVGMDPGTAVEIGIAKALQSLFPEREIKIAAYTDDIRYHKERVIQECWGIELDQDGVTKNPFGMLQPQNPLIGDSSNVESFNKYENLMITEATNLDICAKQEEKHKGAFLSFKELIRLYAYKVLVQTSKNCKD